MDSSAVTLAPATPADIEVLIELEESVAGPHTYSAMLEREDWNEAFKTESIFLIKKEEETIGNLSYELKTPNHLYISGLVVRPEFQGRGFAKQVLKDLLEEFASVKRIDLVTHPENPARKLYESLGFVVESRKENYWGDGEPRLTLVLEG